MKLSLFGRWSMALFASLALGLGMTACGGGTIGYMWVLGQEYNNIAGFKIDDYTGNLTQIINSPFATNGVTPVSIVIKPGGRYVYVVNQGTCPTTGCGTAANTGQGVSVFSVGGDGTLSYQLTYQTQGYDSQWAQIDATGTYLYVLDKYAPYLPSGNTTIPNTSGLGAITVFSMDSTTGRLTLVTNSQTQVNSINTPFWVVGKSPFMMKVTSGCLFTLNAGTQTVTPYAIAGSQLDTVTTGAFQLPSVNATSINSNGTYVIFTDNKTTPGQTPSVPGQIYQYTVGTSCNLAAAQGGGGIALTSSDSTPNPTYSLIDSTGRYLYVLNSSNSSTLTTSPQSTISAFTINGTNSELQPISGSPYTVGSGPVCIAEDPTNQYMYISNYNDGTVTGKVLDPTTGIISDLSRGSTFAAVGHASCLAISGSVN
jgi:6-phosphogluconolactonase (cycloisomerase 2 family)